ncbi:YnfA family protein [Nonomuraea sp. NPDC049152]|uniref:YnfA family protein n=1 Tax=Nonomuraea sp. NPDC049152 TaxID=3154350 RepID=UPI0033F12E7E
MLLNKEVGLMRTCRSAVMAIRQPSLVQAALSAARSTQHAPPVLDPATYLAALGPCSCHDPDAYGGVFVAGSLAWGMVIDGFRPDRWDVIGALVCLAGVLVIMYAPRG